MATILVVEDDMFLAKAYQMKLSKTQHTVKLAHDGQEAIKILEEGYNPDIILLDLVMPNMDGFEVLKQIKEDDDWKNIKIVVATNLGQSEDIEKAKSLGAADYIIKSNMSLEEILAKIDQHLGGASAEASEPTVAAA